MQTTTDQRRTAILRVLVGILAANIVVALAKVGYGHYTGSLAIQADAFHSILDALNNILGIWVVRVATAPPDEGHPYGHGKFEVLGSLTIGALVVILVFKILFASFASLAAGEGVNFGHEAYVLYGLTLAANLAITWVEHRAGEKLNSPFLMADAKHTLSDVFVSAAVIIGVMGSRAGFAQADAVAAFVVASVIAWLGYTILQQGVHILADAAALDSDAIEAVAMGVDGVRKCGRVRSRGGAGHVQVDLIIQVDNNLTVLEAHHIADRVELAVQSRWSEVSEVVVHVEPESA